MIRTIFTVLFVVLFLILSLPFFGLEWILGKLGNKRASDIRQLRLVQWAFRVVLFLAGAKVTYLGDENIPKDTGVLYVANHRGIFDIVSAYSHLPDLTGFISKDSVAKVPILSFIMRRLYCLFLNRKDPKEGYKTITESFGLLKKGISVFIFPEGTRNKNDDNTSLNMFHNGSFKAAQRTACPVVPVAISNSDRILEKQFPKLKAGRIIVRFGKPVLYAELSEENKKNIGDHFADVIADMLKENEALLTK